MHSQYTVCSVAAPAARDMSAIPDKLGDARQESFQVADFVVVLTRCDPATTVR